jgi:hypothetical protein
MIGKLIILMIISIFVAAAVLLYTEPKSEFHAKAKFFMSVKLFELQKMINPNAKMD